MYFSSKNISETLRNNLCTGCGICAPSCPENAISISFNKNLEYRPDINQNLCTDCGICRKACPMDVLNLSKRIDRALHEKENYGIEDNGLFFQGYTSDSNEYFKSSSGGILSTILKYLIEKKEVDAVVHAEKLSASQGKTFFRASISKTAEEIDNKRSSFYYPIEFSGVLREIADNPDINSVVVVAIPCALSGIQNLRRVNKKIDQKIKFLFSLACSHNTSGQFAERISKNLGDCKGDSILNFREKEGISKAENFKNSLLFQNGEKISLSRFKSPFTIDWRTYSYAWNSCLFCPDFWGEGSDASFKDAWGVVTQRKEGETLFHLKNKYLLNSVSSLVKKGKIHIQEMEKQRFLNSQSNTIRYKTEGIAERVKKHPDLKKQFRSFPEHPAKFFKKLDYRIKRKNLIRSRKKWRKNSRPVNTQSQKIREFLLRKTDGMIEVLSSGKYHDGKEKEVLYTAGFGYGNIGDEAQLRTNLNIWSEKKDYKITLLSPNPNQSRKLHGNYDILLASRISFWGVKGVEYSGIGNRSVFRIYFFLKFNFLKINAFFLKNFGFTAFLRPEASYLLQRLKKASVLHIGGGGFLMGKTSSRLYDYMALINLMKYFGNDIILSGQNIGSFNHWYQSILAKNLKKADLIGLRDKSDSLRDLKKIKVPENKTIALFDDALFCDELDIEDFYSLLKEKNISSEDKYVVVNVHYWKAPKEKVNTCLDIMAQQLDQLIYKGFKVLLVPMDPNDRSAIYRLKNVMCENPPILMYDMNVPLLVSAFRNAFMTITMKHHPIVFSMSGSVPVLSVAFEDYYFHKNEGALELFGQEKNALKFTEKFEEEFRKSLEKIISQRDEISKNIHKTVKKFETKKGYIIHKYTETKKSFLHRKNADRDNK